MGTLIQSPPPTPSEHRRAFLAGGLLPPEQYISLWSRWCGGGEPLTGHPLEGCCPLSSEKHLVQPFKQSNFWMPRNHQVTPEHSPVEKKASQGEKTSAGRADKWGMDGGRKSLQKRCSVKGSWLLDPEVKVFRMTWPGSFMRPTCEISVTNERGKAGGLRNVPIILLHMK